jgi:hypothetical protein
MIDPKYSQRKIIHIDMDAYKLEIQKKPIND